MGLFDFLNKKEKKAVAKTELEQLLEQATANANERGAFYKKLMTEKLFVITDNNDLKAGAQKLKNNTTVRIRSLSDGSIPAFTSVDRIVDGGVVKERVQHMEVGARDLLTFTKGAAIVLNPFSECSKQLHADEIAKLLDGSIFDNRPA